MIHYSYGYINDTQCIYKFESPLTFKVKEKDLNVKGKFTVTVDRTTDKITAATVDIITNPAPTIKLGIIDTKLKSFKLTLAANNSANSVKITAAEIKLKVTTTDLANLKFGKLTAKLKDISGKIKYDFVTKKFDNILSF